MTTHASNRMTMLRFQQSRPYTYRSSGGCNHGGCYGGGSIFNYPSGYGAPISSSGSSLFRAAVITNLVFTGLNYAMNWTSQILGWFGIGRSAQQQPTQTPQQTQQQEQQQRDLKLLQETFKDHDKVHYAISQNADGTFTVTETNTETNKNKVHSGTKDAILKSAGYDLPALSQQEQASKAQKIKTNLTAKMADGAEAGGKITVPEGYQKTPEVTVSANRQVTVKIKPNQGNNAPVIEVTGTEDNIAEKVKQKCAEKTTQQQQTAQRQPAQRKAAPAAGPAQSSSAKPAGNADAAAKSQQEQKAATIKAGLTAKMADNADPNSKITVPEGYSQNIDVLVDNQGNVTVTVKPENENSGKTAFMVKGTEDNIAGKVKQACDEKTTQQQQAAQRQAAPAASGPAQSSSAKPAGNADAAAKSQPVVSDNAPAADTKDVAIAVDGGSYKINTKENTITIYDSEGNAIKTREMTDAEKALSTQELLNQLASTPIQSQSGPSQASDATPEYSLEKDVMYGALTDVISTLDASLKEFETQFNIKRNDRRSTLNGANKDGFNKYKDDLVKYNSFVRDEASYKTVMSSWQDGPVADAENGKYTHVECITLKNGQRAYKTDQGTFYPGTDGRLKGNKLVQVPKELLA